MNEFDKKYCSRVTIPLLMPISPRTPLVLEHAIDSKDPNLFLRIEKLVHQFIYKSSILQWDKLLKRALHSSDAMWDLIVKRVNELPAKEIASIDFSAMKEIASVPERFKSLLPGLQKLSNEDLKEMLVKAMPAKRVILSSQELLSFLPLLKRFDPKEQIHFLTHLQSSTFNSVEAMEFPSRVRSESERRAI